MKKLTTFVTSTIASYLLLGSVSFVSSQVIWSPIVSNPSFDVGMNYDSIKRSNGIAKFRILTTDKSDRSMVYEDLELDCQQKTYRSVWAKRYDWRSKVKGETSTPSNWQAVQPNTVISVISTKVCN
jgi:hypothetical protein